MRQIVRIQRPEFIRFFFMYKNDKIIHIHIYMKNNSANTIFELQSTNSLLEKLHTENLKRICQEFTENVHENQAKFASTAFYE